MDILHGMSEVAGQGIYSVLGLKANGYNANMAVWVKNPTNYPTDICIGVEKNNKVKYPIYALKMGAFALKALMKYDVYHSHYGYSLLPFNLDVPLITTLNKSLFAEFHGSDLRFVFKDVHYDYYNVELPSDEIRKRVQKRLLKLLRHSKGIILHDAELIEHLPKTDLPVYIVPLRVDLSKFSPAYPNQDKKKPIVVHAPSKRSTKGTDKILRALESVTGEFELILVENKTQEEAIEIYKQADIIIDQISVGTYGVFAIEAMALGKPVITYISDEMRESLPESLPIVSADFDSLPKIMEELIQNGEKRFALGMAGRKYAERYHDNVKIAGQLAKIYEGTIAENNLFRIL